jgi:hypothetical protein
MPESTRPGFPRTPGTDPVVAIRRLRMEDAERADFPAPAFSCRFEQSPTDEGVKRGYKEALSAEIREGLFDATGITRR